MPVKRRLPKARPYRITPEAVEAFKAGDDEALREALGLRPWEWPTLPGLDEECVWPPGSGGADWHPIGQQLHRDLIGAAKEADEDEADQR